MKTRGRLTLALVLKKLGDAGMVLRKNDGEFTVYRRFAKPDGPATYHTNDLEDALETGLKMSEFLYERDSVLKVLRRGTV